MKKSILAASFIITALIAFGIGRITAPQRTANRDGAGSAQQARANAADESPDSRSTPVQLAEPNRSTPLRLAPLDDILANESLIEALPQFEQHLELLTPQNAFSTLAKLEALPNSRRKSVLMNRLFRKWGEVDGAVAFETAQALDGQDRLRFLGEAAAGWSSVDLVSAWDSLMIASNDGALQQLPLGPALREVAKTDIDLAMTLMSDLSGNQGASNSRFRAILNVAADQGQFEQVLQSVMTNGELPSKDRYLKSLFEAWGKTDLAAPLQTLAQFEDKNLSRQAMSGLMKGWASVDSKGAFSYALAHSNDPLLARSLPELAKQVARNSTAEEMFAAFNEVKDPAHQRQIARSISSDLAKADPHAAMRWASQLQDDKVKSQSIAQILSTYAANDYDGARSYYLTLEDPAVQLQTLTGLAYSQVRQSRTLDLDETVELIDAINDPATRERALERVSGLASRMNRQDNLHFTDQYITMIENRDDLTRSKKDKLIRQALPRNAQKKR